MREFARFAVNQIESAGMRRWTAVKTRRSFERLLHGVGATDDAYRLESARKHRQTTAAVPSGARPGRQPRIDLRTLAIAGGHAQLRGTAASSAAAGMESQIVSIPSSQEAVRRERDIVRLLQGCDLAMLLVRQITHSTSDQVRKAAERVGVPVIYSNALSAVAIERQLFERDR